MWISYIELYTDSGVIDAAHCSRQALQYIDKSAKC